MTCDFFQKNSRSFQGVFLNLKLPKNILEDFSPSVSRKHWIVIELNQVNIFFITITRLRQHNNAFQLIAQWVQISYRQTVDARRLKHHIW